MPNPILCSIPPIASHQNRWDRSASSDVACLQSEPTTVCGVRRRASERRLISVVCSMKSLVKFQVASRLRQGIRQPGTSSTASTVQSWLTLSGLRGHDRTEISGPLSGSFRRPPPREAREASSSPRHGHLSKGRPHARHLRGGRGQRPQEPPQSPRERADRRTSGRRSSAARSPRRSNAAFLDGVSSVSHVAGIVGQGSGHNTAGICPDGNRLRGARQRSLPSLILRNSQPIASNRELIGLHKFCTTADLSPDVRRCPSHEAW